MCGVCGCANPDNQVKAKTAEQKIRAIEQGAIRIRVEREILGRNQLLARENATRFRERGVLALNVMSSPGAGKTTLLEQTISNFRDRAPIHVIEGDQATERDATRIRNAGARAIQINTGAGCHLDASMVARAFEELAPEPGSLLVIENVGNLVCPALFPLGERQRIVVSSVTEGEDKPEKYPHMFRSAHLVLLNKMDLLPFVEFSVDRFTDCLKQVNPNASLLPVSAKAPAGLHDFFTWLDRLWVTPARTEAPPGNPAPPPGGGA